MRAQEARTPMYLWSLFLFLARSILAIDFLSLIMARNQLTPKEIFQALEDLLPPDFPEGSWYIIAVRILLST